MAENPILILGMPNSGGSELAASLAGQGISFGDHEELTRFNLRCLSTFGMNLASIGSLPACWQSHPMTRSLSQELDSLLVGRAGIHQPAATLLMPLYLAAFSRLGLAPTYKVCVRDPVELSRTSPAGAAAIGVWLRHTLGAMEVAGDKRLQVVPQGDFPEPWGVPKLVVDTVALCRDFSSERLAPLLKEFDHWRNMLALPGNPGTQMGFSWVERGVNQVAQAPFLPTGDWQTVRMTIPAPPSTFLSGLLYGRPCRIWIRRCEWLPGRTAKLMAGPGSHLSSLDAIWRLDGAYESRQVSLITPHGQGPFEFEIEFLLEASPSITIETASRLAKRLNQCAARNLAARGAQ